MSVHISRSQSGDFSRSIILFPKLCTKASLKKVGLNADDLIYTVLLNYDYEVHLRGSQNDRENSGSDFCSTEAEYMASC